MGFLRRGKKPTVNQELLTKLIRSLQGATSQNVYDHDFIHPDEVKVVFPREYVRELFSSLDWYEENQRDTLWSGMRLILCTLIIMPETDWDDFAKLFFHSGSLNGEPRWTDPDLPVDLEELLENNIPESLANDFHRKQFQFVPVIIKEYTHRKYPARYRLPIIANKSLEDASGAQGSVDKVLIQRKFVKWAEGGINDEPKWMACKRITTSTAIGRSSSSTEWSMSERVKKSLKSHAGIMESFATFIHGPSFIFMSEWADGRDLHWLLNHPDQIFREDYQARSMSFSPHNLLFEAWRLADALSFLHNELKCAHQDFKPENVLVFLRPGDRASEAPVGHWKISDFGLAAVQQEITNGTVVRRGRHDPRAITAADFARELSKQPPTRGPGVFQPPEVQDAASAKVSTRRDVWSYGCILSMVLAFAIGGPEKVRDLKRTITDDENEFFYRRTTTSNERRLMPGSERASPPDGGGAELKKAVRVWLNEAVTRANSQDAGWIRSTSDLIKILLNVNVINRPDISEAVQGLEKIKEVTRGRATQCLWRPTNNNNRTVPVIETTIIQPFKARPRVDSKVREPTEIASSSSSSYTEPKNRVKQSNPRPKQRGSQQNASKSSKKPGRNDKIERFVPLTLPTDFIGATIEPLGSAAALWSCSDLYLYDLSPLYTDPALWSQHPDTRPIKPNPIFIQPIDLKKTSPCKKIQLSGRWLAILEQDGQSSFQLSVLYRKERESQYRMRQPSEPLPEAPEDFKLSCSGALALKYRDRIELRTRSSSKKIEIVGEFVCMSFTFDGNYFCLWERDSRLGRSPQDSACNYWTIWSYERLDDTRDHFIKLGRTIQLELPAWNPQKRKGGVFLAPYFSKPQFIACDQEQYTYIVGEESDSGSVARQLDRTDNTYSGFIFPDQERLLLIRGPAHEDQMAEKCSVSNPLQKQSRGSIEKRLDIEKDGAAVVRFNQLGGGVYLLVLKTSGLLVRKEL